jgi:hypothetical protein
MFFSYVFMNQCNLVFTAAYFKTAESTAGMPDFRSMTLFLRSSLKGEHRTLHNIT